MIQPDLGKKISELRKAKNLTQDELATLCNINVRTLQRIEYGDVTPRRYTLKLLFTALNYNFSDSSDLNSTKPVNILWLEQSYKYFLDLFNLKTNKMKKITILSIMFSFVVAGLFLLCFTSSAQKDDKSKMTSVETDTDLKVSGTFNGWDETDVFAARDAKCTISGVYFNVGLITLDKNSHDFHTFVKGKLYQNKVEVYTNSEDIDCINFEAVDIIKSEDKIVLKGKAKLRSICGSNKSSIIEASEIIIITLK